MTRIKESITWQNSIYEVNTPEWRETATVLGAYCDMFPPSGNEDINYIYGKIFIIDKTVNKYENSTVSLSWVLNDKSFQGPLLDTDTIEFMYEYYIVDTDGNEHIITQSTQSITGLILFERMTENQLGSTWTPNFDAIDPLYIGIKIGRVIRPDSLDTFIGFISPCAIIIEYDEPTE